MSANAVRRYSGHRVENSIRIFVSSLPLRRLLAARSCGIEARQQLSGGARSSSTPMKAHGMPIQTSSVRPQPVLFKSLGSIDQSPHKAISSAYTTVRPRVW